MASGKGEAKSTEDEALVSLKKNVFTGVCISWFLAVMAHTMNIQSEAILIRNSCGGDLVRAARLASNCNAAAGLLGLIVNQVGGRLSDSMGRKLFYSLGPIAQAFAGLIAFLSPTSASALAVSKVVRGIFTTFSGTVMGSAAMRDVFTGTELAVKSASAGAVIGLAIVVGPFVEGSILKRMKAGSEHITYAALGVLGLVALIANNMMIPESLSKERRKPFDVGSAVASANPFGFLKLYMEGSATLRKLVTILTLQTMTDGKNMSDLAQIWMREHLKLSIDSIRNFLMGFGLLSVFSGAKITPTLLKNLSVWRFTTFTNSTNFVAFSLRGLYEQAALWYGVMPLMLPGVNASSTAALAPVVNKHMELSGFGVGESSAWLNNLRVMSGIAATVLYGYFYSFCRKRGIYPGYTFALAGLVGAALPQAILMLTVTQSELRPQAEKAKSIGSKA